MICIFRLLHFHGIEQLDDAEAEEPIPVPTKDNKPEKEQIRKKKKQTKDDEKDEDNNEGPPILEPQILPNIIKDSSQVPSSESCPESPTDYMVDYNALVPNIAIECNDANITKKDICKKPLIVKKIPRPDSVKEAVEISKKLKSKSDIAVQRLGSNPSISVRQLFPGEEELPLQGNIDFNNIKERTPEGWEKCSTTIQYDYETKQLWQELQKPYGNQSSFLRHLILLEKYFRNGDLILSPNASHHAVNYSESVQNRLRAYDNTPSTSGPIQPLCMIPFNKFQKTPSGIITSKETNPISQTIPVLNAANIPKNIPISISQLTNPNSNFLITINKQKAPIGPPSLMPLQPGTNKPVSPLIKVPQSQKIKFPITKNWRPGLIPIDPNKKLEKKSGLVQVISSGRPYHITVEDYKKMCAIKRTFDLKQKKLQESQKAAKHMSQRLAPTTNSILKTLSPQKGLIIAKTSVMNQANEEMESVNAERRDEATLEKLNKEFERIKTKLNTDVRSFMVLPKIPKSLTVIPQTVAKKPPSPTTPTPPSEYITKPKVQKNL